MQFSRYGTSAEHGAMRNLLSNEEYDSLRPETPRFLSAAGSRFAFKTLVAALGPINHVVTNIWVSFFEVKAAGL
jgi:hypothetical protein